MNNENTNKDHLIRLLETHPELTLNMDNPNPNMGEDRKQDLIKARLEVLYKSQSIADLNQIREDLLG